MTDIPSIDIGFIPVGIPGVSGSGSTQTSSLLIKELSEIHDLSVYVLSSKDINETDLLCAEHVDYNIIKYNGKFPHTHYNRRKALQREIKGLESHDLIHSYSSGFIPELSLVDNPTITTLNSYIPVCPKDSLIYHDESSCSGPNLGKCINCIARSGSVRTNPVDSIEHMYYRTGSLINVRKSIEKRDTITAYHSLSPHLTETYQELGFKNVNTIPHFYNQAFLKEWTELNDPIKLLYAGKLTEKKGVDMLPYALKSASFDYELSIAGRGSLEQELRNTFNDLGMSERVNFLGFVDYEEMPRLYESADIFIYPGRWAEPFGRIFLEALATETPIISTNVGNTEFIIGEAGLVYSVEEFEAKLCQGIIEIVDNYQTFTQNCRNEITRFSKKRIIDQFNDLYAETMNSYN